MIEINPYAAIGQKAMDLESLGGSSYDAIWNSLKRAECDTLSNVLKMSGATNWD